jgi:hypothetical protein
LRDLIDSLVLGFWVSLGRKGELRLKFCRIRLEIGGRAEWWLVDFEGVGGGGDFFWMVWRVVLIFIEYMK